MTLAIFPSPFENKYKKDVREMIEKQKLHQLRVSKKMKKLETRRSKRTKTTRKKILKFMKKIQKKHKPCRKRLTEIEQKILELILKELEM